MPRSEPLVDWIEIHDTIVAVMSVEANPNRLSVEASPLHAAGRSPAGSRTGAFDAAVLTPLRLSTLLTSCLKADSASGFARLGCPPAGGGAPGGFWRGNLPT